MTYAGKWTCSECGDTSDNEHDPCSCDDTCADHIETIDSLRRRLKQSEAERDTARAEAEQLRSAQGTVVVDGLTYGEHMTRDLRAQLAQRERGWDALVKLIATTVGTEEDRDCAENDEMTEFDPWHALRTRASEVEQLRAERDAAVPILDAAYRWHDADKILDGENEDNANSREMFNARRNRWRSIESLRAALDAWRTTKGDAGK